MTARPSCYPVRDEVPLLDVLTSPVPQGRFDSPLDDRHVLCLHLGAPVPVSYRAGRYERQGARLHGQFCVVPAGSSTRWTLTAPATSLLLRLNPSLLQDAAGHMRLDPGLVPAIHIRDPQIERIGWMMRAEEQDGHPGGRIFADSLASALAARLLLRQTLASLRPAAAPVRALPAWQLQAVQDYVEANLDQDLTLVELAAVTGFSVSHFKELFRHAAGMPVHRYVLICRVERARQLLLQGKLSNTEIALEAGFAHPSHMARCMRQLLGLAPAQFRAKA
ncbi:AraC family transcriptional regulator [Duganella sp. CF458]|uniref:helix-turn-helix domain-containing protein n=1 Tax=Duganella sp. CF458 TaxID=1884368 RepID=UPI0008E7ABB9|nr:AraC family transcriptional regulator [Duganella sp. CF458]SFF56950.1 AraC family transcriptional regulator [Duganella sp. CF458]